MLKFPIIFQELFGICRYLFQAKEAGGLQGDLLETCGNVSQ